VLPQRGWLSSKNMSKEVAQELHDCYTLVENRAFVPGGKGLLSRRATRDKRALPPGTKALFSTSEGSLI
jgi:hypothetical protein